MLVVAGLGLSIVAAVIPAGIYSWFVNWLDRHEREPSWLLFLTFLWGALPAVGLALMAQLVLDIPTTWIFTGDGLAYEIVGGSLWAPITEELAKGLGILLLVLVARREFDNILDGIVYGAMAGLGFAFTENIFYFVGALLEAGWGNWVFVVLLRTVPFGLNHAFFTGLVGAGLGLARLSLSTAPKILGPASGLVAGMVFHGLHNLGAALAAEAVLALCFSLVVDWSGLALVGILVVLVWRQERGWMIEHLAGEVTPEILALVTSWTGWHRLRWSAMLRGDTTGWRRLGQLRHGAAELAFKKYQQVHRGQTAVRHEAIERHRLLLASLGATPPPTAG